MLNLKIFQVAGLSVTAVGGHYTLSDIQMSPSPWKLYLGEGLQGHWVDQGGMGGKSGAITTAVKKKWLEKLCSVRGFT